jgi:hypothetical protein
MASTNTTANKLKEAITLLCVTYKYPHLIGGSEVNIKLHALPIDKNLRKHILSGISEANNLHLPNKDRCMIFQHISTHQEILDDPSLTTYLALYFNFARAFLQTPVSAAVHLCSRVSSQGIGQLHT